jgi:chromosome segregation ATPase
VSADEKNHSYVTVVRDELQQYTQGLLRENEKLRAMATALESDKRRLELEVIEARLVLQQKEDLRRAAEKFEAARMETLMQSEKARHDCDNANLELDRLRSRFEDVEQENEKYASQYHLIEHDSAQANQGWPRNTPRRTSAVAPRSHRALSVRPFTLR